MEKKFLITGSVFMLIAVVLGAMAAHALKNYLSTEQINSFETGVRYLVYHGLALLILSQVQAVTTGGGMPIFWLFTIGVILFSGSIFLLATSGITSLNFKFLGPVTPIGGLLLISGWVFVIVKIVRYNS